MTGRADSRDARGSSAARPVVVAAAAVLVALPVLDRAGPGPGRAPPTFAKDIAPIVYRACASCHRPGGSAPFSLLSYADVQQRAALVADAVQARRMPPWLPDAGVVQFAGERRLSEREIRLIRQWVDAGAPPGDLDELPPTPDWPAGWQLGEPDLTVTFPRYTVPPSGPDRYRNLVARVPLAETRYVRAVELRPGNPRVVHHARLMIDTTGSSRARAAEQAAPGFDAMLVGTEAHNPEGFFVGWTPGRVPHPGRNDVAWPLPADADLVLQLHLRPAGESLTVEPALALHFAADPPARVPAIIVLGTKTIDIPPGEADYWVTDSYELPVAVEALGVYPHAHFLAAEMEAHATLPNGSRRWLLRIADWDFNWQDDYRYAKPIRLPRGSVLSLRYRYDNSAANAQNPSAPPRRVRYGPNSTDEMADLILHVLTNRREDAVVLQADLSWKYYVEETASQAYQHYARGREHAERGELDAALREFRESLALRFDAAAVHAALGDVLAAHGELAAAIQHLEQAIRLARAAGDDTLAAAVEARLDRHRRR